MAEFIYTICAIVSTACAVLLFKSYRNSGGKVLLWVAICFTLLALNNIFVCFDLILFPELDLAGSVVRNVLLATAGSVLLAGLTWELS